MLAAMLMRDEHWRGPGVLIAPAYRCLVARLLACPWLHMLFVVCHQLTQTCVCLYVYTHVSILHRHVLNMAKQPAPEDFDLSQKQRENVVVIQVMGMLVAHAKWDVCLH